MFINRIHISFQNVVGWQNLQDSDCGRLLVLYLVVLLEFISLRSLRTLKIAWL